MKQGHVIFLNGTSSAGKSTLSWEIQAQSGEQYYWLSNDAFTDMPHNSYYAKDWRTTFRTAITMMYKAVRLYVENGINVIIDHVLLDDEHGRRELAECLEWMRGIRVTFVFVKCPLEELKRREVARGDRDIGNAEKQFSHLFPEHLYDIVVDTFTCPVSECASTVLRGHEKFLNHEGMKTAFTRMAEGALLFGYGEGRGRTEEPATPAYSYELVDSADLQSLRDLQVKELRGTAQDGTEEGIVTYGADFVRIASKGKTVGYACIGTYGFYKDMILEYFVTSDCRADSADIIVRFIQKYKCAQWLVSTHDFFAFPLLLDLRLRYEIDAYTFALDDSIGIAFELEPGMTIETTASEEISEVYPLIMQDNFYTGGSIDSLLPLIAGNETYSLRKNGSLIGVGFVGASKRTPRYADIAMIIDRAHRRNGYGVLLVKALVAKCRLRNLIPTAICDVNNAASRNVLQKVGFHLDGCLLLAPVRDLI